jgi:hypothetical protein
MVRPLRLDAWRGDQTVQGNAMNILDLFFALRPENRPVVLDSEYHPRGERPSIPVDGLFPSTGMNKLPSDWNIGDPF